MSYFGELRQHIRPLAAASIGSGTGISLFAYFASVFAPHLVKAFGWSRAQFALVGLTMLASFFVLPVVGRLTDRYGVLRMATFGTFLLPFCLLGFALQQGPLWHYLVASTGVLALGSLTSTLVYTRLIAENFVRATGLALTIVNCVPAALAIGAVPLLNWLIEAQGWRTGYFAVAGFTFAAGLLALSLIPRKPAEGPAEAAAKPAKPVSAKRDYRTIFASRTFWLIFAGMMLCLMQVPLHSSQMNLMLVDQQISTQTAANIVSIYAFGTLVGRIACGLALDRFPTPLVTSLSMVLPSLGFFLLASDINTVPVIAASMFMVGLSIGAEGDLMSYLIARYFKIEIYNTVLGLIFSTSYLAAAMGAFGISRTLAIFDSFSPYLYFVSGTVAVGSLLFLLLPWPRECEKVG